MFRALASAGRIAGAIAAVALAPLPATAQTVATGGGSTTVFPLVEQWIEGFQKPSGDIVVYQPLGSPAGREALDDETVAFALTDVPFAAADAQKQDYAQFPVAFGAIVPVVNLPGGDGLVLDAATLSGLFRGQITRWSDPAIAILNPEAKLPDTAVAVVTRSDPAGATLRFTRFLERESPDFAAALGHGEAVAWPVGTGYRGSAGVAGAVAATPGAIGYAALADARIAKLAVPRLVVGGTRPIAADAPGLQAALTSAFAAAPDVGAMEAALNAAPPPGAWPIPTVTYAAMAKVPDDNRPAVAALRFLDFGLRAGAADAEALGYVAPSADVVARIEAPWAATFKGGDRMPLWPAP
jgi:phosphate transport system substrate-binding protein